MSIDPALLGGATASAKRIDRATEAIVSASATDAKLRQVAATETSASFGAAREAAGARLASVHLLYRVWDATLDRRTCPRCEHANGVAVQLGTPFPDGTPGAVHPWCRCTEWILPVEMLR